jgi:hypothetical protein
MNVHAPSAPFVCASTEDDVQTIRQWAELFWNGLPSLAAHDYRILFVGQRRKLDKEMDNRQQTAPSSMDRERTW